MKEERITSFNVSERVLATFVVSLLKLYHIILIIFFKNERRFALLQQLRWFESYLKFDDNLINFLEHHGGLECKVRNIILRPCLNQISKLFFFFKLINLNVELLSGSVTYYQIYLTIVKLTNNLQKSFKIRQNQNYNSIVSPHQTINCLQNASYIKFWNPSLWV